MRKFPSLKYPGDPETDGVLDGDVVVTEKLDGANFRFTWDDSGLIVGTRNHTYDLPDENLPHTFRHAVEYVRDTVPLDSDTPLVYFGEAMHLHSIEYPDVEWEVPSKGSPHVSLDSDYPNVVVFDVWDSRAGNWLDWDEIVAATDAAGLQRTRVIEAGDPDGLDLDVPEESMFGGQPEGIVVRRVDGSVRAKKVTDEFKEKNAVSFNDSSKAQSAGAAFVAEYVTDARIEKVAHKLVDRGEYDALKMEMMEDLPRNVLIDAVSENAWELLTSGNFEVEWDDDFKSDVRSRASKKCARVLKKVINEF